MASFSVLAKTALRDSRRNRSRLFLFMSSIILGIAALVAINSFNDNLTEDINRQAAGLLGADLVMSADSKPEESYLSKLDSLATEKSSEISMFSMAYLPSVDETQFVNIKALSGGFPYYGTIKTDPVEAVKSFQENNGLLADEGMMLQYELEIGDSLKLGTQSYPILGKLQSGFGGQNVTSSFAPTVYMAGDKIYDTGLIQAGSMMDYNYYYQIREGFDVDAWKSENRKGFRQDGMRLTTIEDRKEDLREAFDNLNYFLNLVALVSLLLGCIGVASSVFIYIKSKINSIAVFRCLGMSGRDAFMVYFIQIVVLALIGVFLGAAIGSVIQYLIPMVLSDFLSIEVSSSISLRAIAEGMIVGFVITILFALLPLIAVRKISPLRTLRASYEEDIADRDGLRWVVYIAIALSLFGFLFLLIGDLMTAGIFMAAIGISFLLLYLVSKAIVWVIKKWFPKNWSYVFRQGLSNLFRPNNQTQILLVSLGLGTAILTSLFIIQGMLLKNIALMDAGNQPNMILYGIEANQSTALAEITKSYDMPLIQEVPIVTMKLEAWNGKTKKEWFADTTSTSRRMWPARREARVSFRDTLNETETLIQGNFYRPVTSPNDSIFISVEDDWAEALDVTLGDEVVFNVQGTRMKTYIGSLRKISFNNMSTRFFVLFPTGVLEEAPQFRVLVTKSPGIETTAKYRREVVKAFPNVSVIDLGMILNTVNTIIDKLSYIIKFMAGFSILTGLIVLISSLFLSKYQRIKESVLLRTIGASRRQLFLITSTEYLILGALSAATGIIIALTGSYLLTKFQLELDFIIQWWKILLVFVLVSLLTMLIGIFNSREVVTKSPLEVLRREQ